MNNFTQKEQVSKKCRGRPASFKREELVSQVMEMFWEKGYNNLSLNEIAKVTGLTRASLYNAFKTKEALFLEVISNYFAGSPHRVFNHVDQHDQVGPLFYLFFGEVSRNLAADTKQRGCLGVNCMSELSPCNSDLGERIASIIETQRQKIEVLIKQAVEQKELPEDTEPVITANIIQTFLSGLSIFSKNGVTEETLRNMSYKFLRNIGFTEPESYTTGDEQLSER